MFSNVSSVETLLPTFDELIEMYGVCTKQFCTNPRMLKKGKIALFCERHTVRPRPICAYNKGCIHKATSRSVQFCREHGGLSVMERYKCIRCKDRRQARRGLCPKCYTDTIQCEVLGCFSSGAICSSRLPRCALHAIISPCNSCAEVHGGSSRRFDGNCKKCALKLDMYHCTICKRCVRYRNNPTCKSCGEKTLDKTEH